MHVLKNICACRLHIHTCRLCTGLCQWPEWQYMLTLKVIRKQQETGGTAPVHRVILHIHMKKEVVISISLGSKAIHQAINQRPEQKTGAKWGRIVFQQSQRPKEFLLRHYGGGFNQIKSWYQSGWWTFGASPKQNAKYTRNKHLHERDASPIKAVRGTTQQNLVFLGPELTYHELIKD